MLPLTELTPACPALSATRRAPTGASAPARRRQQRGEPAGAIGEVPTTTGGRATRRSHDRDAERRSLRELRPGICLHYWSSAKMLA
jgi:hypothetical protein